MLVILAATMVAALPSLSPAPSPSPSPSLRTIGVTVTTAERRETPLSRTVQPTYVVDRATIERNGFDTIAEAIRNVPGVTLFRYGGFGSQTSFGILGGRTAQTIVLLDGEPLASGLTGGVDLGRLSSSDVERIEVVESGGSTLYGSGGAGGVVNIITAVPREPYAYLDEGSFGERQIRVSDGNGTLGGSFERHVVANDYQYATPGYAPGIRTNGGARQTVGTLDFGRELGSFDVRATARFAQLDAGIPGPVGSPTPREREPSNRNDLFAEASRTSGRFTTSLAVSSYRDALFDNGSDGLGPENALVDARTNVSLKEVVSGARDSALVAGIDLSRESALDILGSFGPPPAFTAAQSQSAVYAQQNIGFWKGARAYAGLRAEHDTPGGGVVEPAGGFLVPLGGIRVAGHAASSFLVPTAQDLYYPNYSNPALRPERDRNLDVSFAGPALSTNPTLTLFDRTATDLITSDANYRPINAGRAHFQGATVSFSPPTLHHLTTTLGLTDLWTATQAAGGVARRADYEPVLQATLALERAMGTGHAAFGLVAKVVGAHTESTGPGSYGDYTLVDVYGRFRLSPHVVLTARAKNVGNENVASFANYPEPGRSYRLELTTR